MNQKALLAVFSIALFSAALTSEVKAVSENNCLACHSRLMKKFSAPARLFAKDVHAGEGLICSDCHGGNPAQTTWHGRKNPAQGFFGKPDPVEIPAFCNLCHGNAEYMKKFNPTLPVDQLVKYRTSRHGILLLEKGDTKAANCVSCHGVHDMRKVNDPAGSVYAVNLPLTCARCHSDSSYMATYGIPTNQYRDFASSVHGVALLERGDLGAPACNDCHGNHGAIPPQVENISQVCGLCHANNAKLYRESFHASIFETLGSPGCETCHGNHRIVHPEESFLGPGEKSVCVSCHQDSPPDSGFAVGLSMKSILDSLAGSCDSVTALVDKAERIGMETSELRLLLRDVRQSLIESRTMIHSFTTLEVRKTAAPGIGLALEIRAGAVQLLAEHLKRRWWLGGLSLVLLALILGLYLKIREIETE